jgi:hypothetical protein
MLPNFVAASTAVIIVPKSEERMPKIIISLDKS